jgi:hypothetical protein
LRVETDQRRSDLARDYLKGNFSHQEYHDNTIYTIKNMI